MGLFGFGKGRKGTAAPALDTDMDVPPKPPEFRVEGPAEPTPEELDPIEAIKPLPPPSGIKPVHVDDLTVSMEHPAELPPLELPAENAQQLPESAGAREVQQAIQAVQEQVPQELPQLAPSGIPLIHEEYAVQEEPALREVLPPGGLSERPLGESVLLRDTGPLFVTLEGYEQMIANIVQVRADLQQAEDRTAALAATRSRMDGHHAKFQQALEHIEQKLSYVDRMLFGEAEE